MKKIIFLFLFILVNYASAFQEDDLSKKIHLADSLLEKQEYQRSKEHWQDILNSDSSSHPTYYAYKSKLFYCEAKLLEATGDYKTAIEKYQTAQQLLNKDTTLNDQEYKLNIYSGLYHSLAYSGNWEAALKKGNQGLSLINPSIDKRVRADYIYDLGYINDRLKNHAEAIDLYQKSIALYKTFEENKNFDLGLAYNNLATVYKQIGFFSERLKSFEKAKKHWEKDSSINPTYLITLYGNMMKLYIEYGDAAKAKQLFTALNNIPNTKLQTEDIFNKLRLKLIYYTFSNQLPKAEKQLEEFNTLFSAIPKKEQAQNSHYYLATLLEMTDEYYQNKLDKKALATSIKAIAIAKTFRQPYYEMLGYTKQTKLASLEKRYKDANHLLDKALAINDQKPIGLVNVVNILIKKANLQVKQNQIKEAHQTIRRALTALAEKEITVPEELTIENFKQQHSSFFVMALKDAAGFYNTIYIQTQQKEAAQHAKYLYELAAEVFGLYYQNGDYNTHLNQLNKEINEGIYDMHTVLQTPLSPAVLAKIEANNSQVLRNEFERKYVQFLSTEDSVLAQRNLLQFQLQNNNKPEKLAQKKLQQAIKNLDEEIATKDPLFQSFYQEKISLRKIQDHLRSNELLIKYFVGEQRIFSLCISKDNRQLFRLAKTDSLKEKLKSFYNKLQNPQKNTLSPSQELYSVLIKPLEEELENHQNITIVPDDFLHYLPFEALEDESGPLVSKHQIQYANSLTLWYFLKNNPQPSKAHKSLFAAFAPQYNTKTDEIALRGNRFKDLQGARKEAQKISEELQGDLFLNDEASIENFINHSSAYKIYHLAMHAVLNEEEYTQSSLIFQNNTSLNFSSLYGLYFPADLVVLSACNTGVGKLAAGEGFLSLSRALTYAGVRSSVYSLWEVPDEETSEIMVSFYHYLSQGKNKVDALAQAKKDFIENNPLKSHPYYWAGFIFNGDATPIVEPQTHTYWYILGGIFLLGGIFFLRHRRRKKLV